MYVCNNKYLNLNLNNFLINGISSWHFPSKNILVIITFASLPLHCSIIEWRFAIVSSFKHIYIILWTWYYISQICNLLRRLNSNLRMSIPYVSVNNMRLCFYFSSFLMSPSTTCDYAASFLASLCLCQQHAIMLLLF